MNLNLGSGQRPFGVGWVNVDIQEKWRDIAIEKGGTFVCGNMGELPYSSDSADVVCCHHTLEHLGCNDAVPVVNEAFRTLKKGGSLLIFVPNMRALCQRWLTRELDDYNFFVNVYGAFMGNEADRHKWNYSIEGWTAIIHGAADWSAVKMFDWRTIDGADIARDWWILGLEAVK